MDPAGCSRTVHQSAVPVFGCFLFVSSSQPLANFKNILPIRIKVLYTVLLGYFGEAMITEKNFFPPASASFENVFRIRCNLRDTTSFVILLPHTTLFPNAQNTSKELNLTPTQILHFTISFHFNTNSSIFWITFN